jgi:SAM-dependent methyltransferase
MSTEAWDDGTAYERYVGRWSRVIADQFVRWLDVAAGAAWLDFGCGTGALTRAILAAANPRLVVGCDRSSAYARFAAVQTTDDRVQFVAAELPHLPRTNGGFDAAVAGLVLNFLPAPVDGVAALATRVRRGGVVAAYVFDYAHGMQMMRVFWDAVSLLDPGARALDEGVRFPLGRPEALERTYRDAGLDGIRVQSLDVPTVFHGFDDYWAPFLGGQGPAPGYVMGLPAQEREDLRALVQSRLPIAADGTIHLTARAWAVQGEVA